MKATLSAEDTLAIHEVIALYAHVNDNHHDNLEALEQLRLVFAENIIWEGVSPKGVEHLEGLDAIMPRYVQAANVPSYTDHHMNSTIITSVVDGRVHTRTHFVAVRSDPDRMVTSGDYLDVLERTDDGWRIVERKIVSRIRNGAVVPRPADVYDGWEIV